jgi:SAM-dependent methyltransferase
MHTTALQNASLFFSTYIPSGITGKLIEIGSQDVNGSLRSVATSTIEYIGLDFAEAKGVDMVLQDPYELPFEDESIDFCVTSSCYEHSEMFWLSFNEVLRVLKPSGLFYMNVPSNGIFHQYPVDCWRFYPDAGKALVTWGRRSGYRPILLESFVSSSHGWGFSDFVAVFLKDEACLSNYPNRILSNRQDFLNGVVYGLDTYLNPSMAMPA